jgi:hypothetical protein
MCEDRIATGSLKGICYGQPFLPSLPKTGAQLMLSSWHTVVIATQSLTLLCRLLP